MSKERTSLQVPLDPENSRDYVERLSEKTKFIPHVGREKIGW